MAKKLSKRSGATRQKKAGTKRASAKKARAKPAPSKKAPAKRTSSKKAPSRPQGKLRRGTIATHALGVTWSRSKLI
jgi:hypothetical protein